MQNNYFWKFFFPGLYYIVKYTTVKCSVLTNVYLNMSK